MKKPRKSKNESEETREKRSKQEILRVNANINKNSSKEVLTP